VGFEPTIPAFERAKTVHALDRADAVIGTATTTTTTTTTTTAAAAAATASTTTTIAAAAVFPWSRYND
jgi:hypothetical protein